jgi:hypothetical protein
LYFVDPFGLDGIVVFSQSTGAINVTDANGNTVAIGTEGYAGQGEGKNNPDMQNKENVGPIPQGAWKIEPGSSNSKGPLTIKLIPDPSTETFNRKDFRIHGEKLPPAEPGNASEGCIIHSRDIRQSIVDLNGGILIVVP